MANAILMFEPLLDPLQRQLEEKYEVIEIGHPSVEARLNDIRVTISGGGIGLPTEWFEKLPNLGLIAINGVGTDKVDLKQAARRRIHVSTTPDVLTDDVADLGLGLILAAMRNLREGDAFVRDGRWASGEKFPLARTLKGKKLGIIGLGSIGQAIGKRAAASNMEIGFWNRSPKSVEGWTGFESPKALAAWSDVLAVAVAATVETQGIVDRAVLEALGKDGVIINIARGSVVDETALLDALESKAIAGAALDVFLNEPEIDRRFMSLDNAFLFPHQGSATVETRVAMAQLVYDNVEAFFAGDVPPTSVTAKQFA